MSGLRGSKLFPWLWDLNCDQSDIDAISTIPSDKDFGVGVVNGKSLVAESPEQVAGGIRKVRDVIPPERLMVYTGCTLTGIKHIVAKRKIEAIVAGPELVRAELCGN